MIGYWVKVIKSIGSNLLKLGFIRFKMTDSNAFSPKKTNIEVWTKDNASGH